MAMRPFRRTVAKFTTFAPPPRSVEINGLACRAFQVLNWRIRWATGFVTCRSASNPDPSKARASAKPSGTTLRYVPPALALRRHNLEGGQLFDADPGQH